MVESIYFLKPGWCGETFCRPSAGTGLTARYKSHRLEAVVCHSAKRAAGVSSTLCLSGPYGRQSGVHIRQPDQVEKRVSYSPERSSVFARPLPDSIPESPSFSLAGVARHPGQSG
jgi:hypothetical protein